MKQNQTLKGIFLLSFPVARRILSLTVILTFLFSIIAPYHLFAVEGDGPSLGGEAYQPNYIFPNKSLTQSYRNGYTGGDDWKSFTMGCISGAVTGLAMAIAPSACWAVMAGSIASDMASGFMYTRYNSFYNHPWFSIGPMHMTYGAMVSMAVGIVASVAVGAAQSAAAEAAGTTSKAVAQAGQAVAQAGAQAAQQAATSTVSSITWAAVRAALIQAGISTLVGTAVGGLIGYLAGGLEKHKWSTYKYALKGAYVGAGVGAAVGVAVIAQVFMSATASGAFKAAITTLTGTVMGTLVGLGIGGATNKVGEMTYRFMVLGAAAGLAYGLTLIKINPATSLASAAVRSLVWGGIGAAIGMGIGFAVSGKWKTASRWGALLGAGGFAASMVAYLGSHTNVAGNSVTRMAVLSIGQRVLVTGGGAALGAMAGYAISGDVKGIERGAAIGGGLTASANLVSALRGVQVQGWAQAGISTVSGLVTGGIAGGALGYAITGDWNGTWRGASLGGALGLAVGLSKSGVLSGTSGWGYALSYLQQTAMATVVGTGVGAAIGGAKGAERGAVLGLAAGAAIGVARFAGYLSDVASTPLRNFAGNVVTSGLRTVSGGLLGMGAGAMLGAGIGYAAGSHHIGKDARRGMVVGTVAGAFAAMATELPDIPVEKTISVPRYLANIGLTTAISGAGGGLLAGGLDYGVTGNWKSAEKWFWRGAAVGAAAGFLSSSESQLPSVVNSRVWTAVLNVPLSTLSGSAMGAALGYFITGKESGAKTGAEYGALIGGSKAALSSTAFGINEALAKVFNPGSLTEIIGRNVTNALLVNLPAQFETGFARLLASSYVEAYLKDEYHMDPGIAQVIGGLAGSCAGMVAMQLAMQSTANMFYMDNKGTVITDLDKAKLDVMVDINKTLQNSMEPVPDGKGGVLTNPDGTTMMRPRMMEVGVLKPDGTLAAPSQMEMRRLAYASRGEDGTISLADGTKIKILDANHQPINTPTALKIAVDISRSKVDGSVITKIGTNGGSGAFGSNGQAGFKAVAAEYTAAVMDPSNQSIVRAYGDVPRTLAGVAIQDSSYAGFWSVFSMGPRPFVTAGVEALLLTALHYTTNYGSATSTQGRNITYDNAIKSAIARAAGGFASDLVLSYGMSPWGSVPAGMDWSTYMIKSAVSEGAGLAVDIAFAKMDRKLSIGFSQSGLGSLVHMAVASLAGGLVDVTLRRDQKLSSVETLTNGQDTVKSGAEQQAMDLKLKKDGYVLDSTTVEETDGAGNPIRTKFVWTNGTDKVEEVVTGKIYVASNDDTPMTKGSNLGLNLPDVKTFFAATGEDFVNRVARAGLSAMPMPYSPFFSGTGEGAFGSSMGIFNAQDSFIRRISLVGQGVNPIQVEAMQFAGAINGAATNKLVNSITYGLGNNLFLDPEFHSYASFRTDDPNLDLLRTSAANSETGAQAAYEDAKRKRDEAAKKLDEARAKLAAGEKGDQELGEELSAPENLGNPDKAQDFETRMAANNKNISDAKTALAAAEKDQTDAQKLYEKTGQSLINAQRINNLVQGGQLNSFEDVQAYQNALDLASVGQAGQDLRAERDGIPAERKALYEKLKGLSTDNPEYDVVNKAINATYAREEYLAKEIPKLDARQEAAWGNTRQEYRDAIMARMTEGNFSWDIAPEIFKNVEFASERTPGLLFQGGVLDYTPVRQRQNIVMNPGDLETLRLGAKAQKEFALRHNDEAGAQAAESTLKAVEVYKKVMDSKDSTEAGPSNIVLAPNGTDIVETKNNISYNISNAGVAMDTQRWGDPLIAQADLQALQNGLFKEGQNSALFAGNVIIKDPNAFSLDPLAAILKDDPDAEKHALLLTAKDDTSNPDKAAKAAKDYASLTDGERAAAGKYLQAMGDIKGGIQGDVSLTPEQKGVVDASLKRLADLTKPPAVELNKEQLEQRNKQILAEQQVIDGAIPGAGAAAVNTVARLNRPNNSNVPDGEAAPAPAPAALSADQFVQIVNDQRVQSYCDAAANILKRRNASPGYTPISWIQGYDKDRKEGDVQRTVNDLLGSMMLVMPGNGTPLPEGFTKHDQYGRREKDVEFGYQYIDGQWQQVEAATTDFIHTPMDDISIRRETPKDQYRSLAGWQYTDDQFNRSLVADASDVAKALDKAEKSAAEKHIVLKVYTKGRRLGVPDDVVGSGPVVGAKVYAVNPDGSRTLLREEKAEDPAAAKEKVYDYRPNGDGTGVLINRDPDAQEAPIYVVGNPKTGKLYIDTSKPGQSLDSNAVVAENLSPAQALKEAKAIDKGKSGPVASGYKAYVMGAADGSNIIALGPEITGNRKSGFHIGGAPDSRGFLEGMESYAKEQAGDAPVKYVLTNDGTEPSPPETVAVRSRGKTTIAQRPEPLLPSILNKYEPAAAPAVVEAAAPITPAAEASAPTVPLSPGTPEWRAQWGKGVIDLPGLDAPAKPGEAVVPAVAAPDLAKAVTPTIPALGKTSTGRQAMVGSSEILANALEDIHTPSQPNYTVTIPIHPIGWDQFRARAADTSNGRERAGWAASSYVGGAQGWWTFKEINNGPMLSQRNMDFQDNFAGNRSKAVKLLVENMWIADVNKKLQAAGKPLITPNKVTAGKELTERLNDEAAAIYAELKPQDDVVGAFVAKMPEMPADVPKGNTATVKPQAYTGAMRSTGLDESLLGAGFEQQVGRRLAGNLDLNTTFDHPVAFTLPDGRTLSLTTGQNVQTGLAQNNILAFDKQCTVKVGEETIQVDPAKPLKGEIERAGFAFVPNAVYEAQVGDTVVKVGSGEEKSVADAARAQFSDKTIMTHDQFVNNFVQPNAGIAAYDATHNMLDAAPMGRIDTFQMTEARRVGNRMFSMPVFEQRDDYNRNDLRSAQEIAARGVTLDTTFDKAKTLRLADGRKLELDPTKNARQNLDAFGVAALDEKYQIKIGDKYLTVDPTKPFDEEAARAGVELDSGAVYEANVGGKVVKFQSSQSIADAARAQFSDKTIMTHDQFVNNVVIPNATAFVPQAVVDAMGQRREHSVKEYNYSPSVVTQQAERLNKALANNHAAAAYYWKHAAAVNVPGLGYIYLEPKMDGRINSSYVQTVTRDESIDGYLTPLGLTPSKTYTGTEPGEKLPIRAR